MRIFSYKTLRLFWEKYPDSRPALEFWHDTIENTIFKNPNEVIRYFKDADTVKNNRIVFNITHNKYRIVAKFEYERESVFIRFIGTHKEYDKIDKISTI